MKKMFIELLLLAAAALVLGIGWNTFSGQGITLGKDHLGARRKPEPSVAQPSSAGGSSIANQGATIGAAPKAQPPGSGEDGEDGASAKPKDAEEEKLWIGGDGWIEEGYQFISIREAVDYYNEEGLAVFVDARKTKSYFEGHISSALHLNHFQSDRLIEGMKDELTSAPNLIVYCGGGDCETSLNLANDLVTLYDFEKESIYVIKGGYEYWSKLQLPITTGEEKGVRSPAKMPEQP